MSEQPSGEILGDILVVDDDRASLRTLSILLEKAGHHVRGAPDGRTALMIAAADPPDLVLLDVIMPGLDGFQVCQQLKSEAATRSIPVIFVSALDETVDKVRGFEVGGVDYVIKPFQREEVLARVRTHLALYDLRAELGRRNVALQQEIAERIQADEALRESEENFRVLAEQSPNMILVDQGGKVLYANAQFESVLGYTRAELYADGFKSDYLVAQESLPMGYQVSVRVLGGEDVPPFEHTFVARDGTLIETILATKQVTYRGETAVLAVVTDITDRKQTEHELRARTAQLDERVKELNCLYGISAVVERPGISLDEILQSAVDLIPFAWQYPEIACARIILDGQEFGAEGCQEAGDVQSSPIYVHGKQRGVVQVTYLEDRPPADEGPFSAEERSLLDAIAQRLGRITERFQAKEALQRRVRELSVLHRISRVVASAADLQEVQAAVAEMVTDLFDARTTLFVVPDAEETELQILIGYERAYGVFVTTSQPLHLHEMPVSRQAIEQMRSVVLPDVQAHPLPGSVRAYVCDLGIHAVMWVPLLSRGAIVGLLIVGSDQPEQTFTPHEVALAETVAGDVAAAIENARLAEQARAAAVNRERGRLARELHDSVTQSLYGITLQADATRLALAAGKVEVVEQRLKRLNEHAREAMTEMRLLIHELRPSLLEEEGLAAALGARLEAVEIRSGLQAELEVEGERRLPDEIESELYRVALEALNNALKHARATAIEVRLSFNEQSVRMRIVDNGSGFDVDRAARYGGYGLEMMRERVQQIGGQFSIQTAPGEGTALCVEVET
jgi:PAS domain S-box-containing protein